MNRGAGLWPRCVCAAAAALFGTLVVATLEVGSMATGAGADVPCYNQFGQQVPCPTTTVPPPTTAPPTTHPPTTQPPPPTTARPQQVTPPPETSPPLTAPPASAATTTPTTAAPTTTAPRPTVPSGPPAILGNFNANASVTTTTIDPSPPSTASEAAVGLPSAPKGHRLSARFIYAMVLDGLLLAGIGGYVVVRRLHLI